MWLDGGMTDAFDDATRRMMATIQANWDERTPIHAASRFYDTGGRVSGLLVRRLRVGGPG